MIRSLFFGNYFYGICAIALSIEASLQQHIALNSPLYYLFVFTATVLYYTHAYIAETDTQSGNQRTLWYSRHRTAVTVSQVIITLIFLVTGMVLCQTLATNLSQVSPVEWLLAAIFPLIAALYYGSVRPNSTRSNLRNKGWLKPFVIGFVWAGAVTVYPAIWRSIEDNTPYAPGWVNALLFVKNLMFVTMLCIMFDIKDYAADHNRKLKTFVVQLGLRKTIFYILIPLSLIGLGTFILYAVLRDFPFLRIAVNTVPFILLIIVARSLHQRKSILYYLAIIDGLMLVKAVCGIIGISLIK